MNILVIHEVDYFKKVVFEFQILAEIFSSLGHKVTVLDYSAENSNKSFKKDHLLGAWRTNNAHRVSPNASMRIVRPFCSRLSFLKRPSYALNFKRVLRKIINSQKIDFILLYGVAHNGRQTINLAKEKQIPVIFRSIDVLHKLVPHKIYRLPVKFLEKYVYKNSDLILALTPKLKDYVVRMGAEQAKVRLQLAGVDTDLYRPLPKNWELAKKWGLNKKDKIVLFAGTLYKFSSLDWLAENWKLVLEKVPEAKLLILGNGPLFKKLRAIIEKGGPGEKIILADWQPYELLPDFINLAAVCINLFEINDITRDIIPTKLFQYSACAKPVIAFPLPGTIDILPGEKEGIVYAKDRPEVLNLIIKMLKNKNKAEKIGQNGYELMKKKYGWNKIADNILKTAKILYGKNEVSNL